MSYYTTPELNSATNYHFHSSTNGNGNINFSHNYTSHGLTTYPHQLYTNVQPNATAADPAAPPPQASGLAAAIAATLVEPTSQLTYASMAPFPASTTGDAAHCGVEAGAPGVAREAKASDQYDSNPYLNQHSHAGYHMLGLYVASTPRAADSQLLNAKGSVHQPQPWYGVNPEADSSTRFYTRPKLQVQVDRQLQHYAQNARAQSAPSSAKTSHSPLPMAPAKISTHQISSTPDINGFVVGSQLNSVSNELRGPHYSLKQQEILSPRADAEGNPYTQPSPRLEADIFGAPPKPFSLDAESSMPHRAFSVTTAPDAPGQYIEVAKPPTQFTRLPSTTVTAAAVESAGDTHMRRRLPVLNVYPPSTSAIRPVARRALLTELPVPDIDVDAVRDRVRAARADLQARLGESQPLSNHPQASAPNAPSLGSPRAATKPAVFSPSEQNGPDQSAPANSQKRAHSSETQREQPALQPVLQRAPDMDLVTQQARIATLPVSADSQLNQEQDEGDILLAQFRQQRRAQQQQNRAALDSIANHSGTPQPASAFSVKEVNAMSANFSNLSSLTNLKDASTTRSGSLLHPNSMGSDLTPIATTSSGTVPQPELEAEPENPGAQTLPTIEKLNSRTSCGSEHSDATHASLTSTSYRSLASPAGARALKVEETSYYLDNISALYGIEEVDLSPELRVKIQELRQSFHLPSRQVDGSARDGVVDVVGVKPRVIPAIADDVQSHSGSIGSLELTLPASVAVRDHSELRPPAPVPGTEPSSPLSISASSVQGRDNFSIPSPDAPKPVAVALAPTHRPAPVRAEQASQHPDRPPLPPVILTSRVAIQRPSSPSAAMSDARSVSEQPLLLPTTNANVKVPQELSLDLSREHANPGLTSSIHSPSSERSFDFVSVHNQQSYEQEQPQVRQQETSQIPLSQPVQSEPQQLRQETDQLSSTLHESSSNNMQASDVVVTAASAPSAASNDHNNATQRTNPTTPTAERLAAQISTMDQPKKLEELLSHIYEAIERKTKDKL